MTGHTRGSVLRRALGQLENWKYTLGSAVDAGNQPFRLTSSARLADRLARQEGAGLRSRRVIFCANPGRSGSDYMATLMSDVPGCVSRHEARPKMNGAILRLVEEQGLEPTYAARQIKVLAINSILLREPPDAAYFESNHMFAKTFADVVCDYYREVDVIILRRQPQKVLRSFAQLGYFTNKNPAWTGWMNDPVSSDKILRSAFPGADQIDRIIAYLASVEQRIDILRATYPEVRFHNQRLEDLASVDGARQLLSKLDLGWDPSLSRRIERVRNARSDRKSFFGFDIPESLCEKRLEQFYDRLSMCGIKLPDVRYRWDGGSIASGSSNGSGEQG